MPLTESTSVNAIGPAVSETRGSFPPYALLACSAVFFWVISIRAVIYTAMPAVATDLGLSTSLAGLVIAAQLLSYCVSSWFAGWLPGSRKARVMAGMLLSVPAVALVALAPNSWTLLAASLLSGLGMGVYLPLGLSLIVEMGGKGRRASYLAVHETAATLGSFGGSAFVGAVLAAIDWRGSVLVWCAVGVSAIVAFAFVGDEEGAGRLPARRGAVVLSRPVMLSAVTYGVGTILVSGLVSVLPLVMVRGWALDQSYAANVIGYTRLAGLAGVLAAGLLADRLGHQRVLLVLQCLSVAGALIMSAGSGPLLVPGMAMMAVGASGNIALLPMVLAAAFGPAARERALAFSIGIGGFSGMVITPAIFGAMVDAALPSGPMLLTAVAAMGMILATRRLTVLSPGA